MKFYATRSKGTKCKSIRAGYHYTTEIGNRLFFLFFRLSYRINVMYHLLIH